MGGIVCGIPWRAIVRYEAVPQQRDEQKKLETQLRQAYTVPSIYEAIHAENKGVEVCALLAKHKLTLVELTRLFELGESLYETYPEADDTPGG